MAGRSKSAEEREAIEIEAARLFHKARESDREDDLDAALAWAAADPHQGVAFAKVEASWEVAERLCEVSPMERLDAVLPRELRVLVKPRVVIALVAATVIGIATTVTLQLGSAVDHYRTALGQERVVRLADGSLVHLNTDSSVEVSLRSDVRSVNLLHGEALFDVAHDTARPFLVEAGSATVRAVGTKFNVRLRSELTEVTVIKGAVAVKDGSSARQIGAGSTAAIRSGAVAVSTLAPNGLQQRIAWQHRMIEFDGDTLAQAVEEFNRYRTTPLVIGDPSIAGIRIGGSFHSDGSEGFVHALEQNFNIRAVNGRDNSIILFAAGPQG